MFFGNRAEAGSRNKQKNNGDRGEARTRQNTKRVEQTAFHQNKCFGGRYEFDRPKTFFHARGNDLDDWGGGPETVQP